MCLAFKALLATSLVSVVTACCKLKPCNSLCLATVHVQPNSQSTTNASRLSLGGKPVNYPWASSDFTFEAVQAESVVISWIHSGETIQFTATPTDPTLASDIVQIENSTGLVHISPLKPSTEYMFMVKEKDGTRDPIEIAICTTLPFGNLLSLNQFPP